MVRKNIKRPRLNSKKKRRNRHYKELAAQKFSALAEQPVFPIQDPQALMEDILQSGDALGLEANLEHPIGNQGEDLAG